MVNIGQAFVLICSICLSLSGWAQDGPTSRYWVFFIDKPNVEVEPMAAKTVERRILNGFPATNVGDIPVDSIYLNQVADLASELGYASRWFNAVGVEASREQIEQIEQLAFVDRVQRMNTARQMASVDETTIVRMTEEMKKQAKYPLQRMGKELLDSLGLDGSGVRVAVLDGGFPSINSHEAFEHLRSSDRIKATYDFVKKTEDIDRANSHGLSVLSNIAGIMDEDQALGLATGAEFVLGRTEAASEPSYEEDLWVAGVEWAERHGAQILNSSLGYTYHRYFQQEMDGSSMIARAGSAAAARGLLVINAAGNEGSNYWEVIITPSDGDSVLAVGGVDPSSDLHIEFGSYGPTADGRMKPNVSNFAQTIAAKPSGYSEVFGTSFASPLTTGFAACLLQYYPQLTAMELFDMIEKSGHLYPYYDYAHGYGIPRADRVIFAKGVEAELIRFEKVEEGLEVELNYDASLVASVNQYLGWNHAYVHIEGPDGRLEHYWVYEVVEGDDLFFKKDWFKNLEGGKVRVHFRGSTNEFKL